MKYTFCKPLKFTHLNAQRTFDKHTPVDECLIRIKQFKHNKPQEFYFPKSNPTQDYYNSYSTQYFIHYYLL